MDMKRIVDERIVKILDHAYINEIIANPSAEFISVWVWRKLGDLPLHEIKVWETPTSFVTYQGPPTATLGARAAPPSRSGVLTTVRRTPTGAARGTAPPTAAGRRRDWAHGRARDRRVRGAAGMRHLTSALERTSGPEQARTCARTRRYRSRRARDAGPPYLLEKVDDVGIVQLYADGFERLPVKEKILCWHLSQAVIAGRDIFIQQKCAEGLEIRDLLEEILDALRGRRSRDARRDPPLHEALLGQQRPVQRDHVAQERAEAASARRCSPRCRSWARTRPKTAGADDHGSAPDRSGRILFDPDLQADVHREEPRGRAGRHRGLGRQLLRGRRDGEGPRGVRRAVPAQLEHREEDRERQDDDRRGPLARRRHPRPGTVARHVRRADREGHRPSRGRDAVRAASRRRRRSRRSSAGTAPARTRTAAPTTSPGSPTRTRSSTRSTGSSRSTSTRAARRARGKASSPTRTRRRRTSSSRSPRTRSGSRSTCRTRPSSGSPT